ncbi:hypothetical protein [Stenotrophomonas geniculata]|uniref:hypothetical protein n=1 Tax=Stenotrophomonas geniculata TaxID=86188 RepID=UPI002ACECAFE|nr:hypothetical protein [Stenotrophomonas geniculata]
MQNSKEETLGLDGAATLLRLGHEAMINLINRDEVPAVRLNQKHTVMLREDLIEFLRSEGRRQAAERKKSAIGMRPTANSPPLGQTRRASNSRRIKLPDLRAYEQADHQS